MGVLRIFIEAFICLFVGFFIPRVIINFVFKFTDFMYSEQKIKEITGIDLRKYPQIIDMLILSKNLEVVFNRYRVNGEGLKLVKEYFDSEYSIELKEIKEL